MYREFRELEGKIASFSGASSEVPAGAGPPTETISGEPAERPMTDAAAGDSARVGSGAVSDSRDLLAMKRDRDAKKHDIKQWIKEFEEREGHTPTAK